MLSVTLLKRQTDPTLQRMGNSCFIKQATNGEAEIKTDRGSRDKQRRGTRRPLLWPRRRPVPRSQSAAAVRTCSPSAAPSRWPMPPPYCKTQNNTRLVMACLINHWYYLHSRAGATQEEIYVAPGNSLCLVFIYLFIYFKSLQIHNPFCLGKSELAVPRHPSLIP